MNIRKAAAVLVLVVSTIAATDVAPSKSELEAMYDRAFRAFDAAKYDDALKELDAIDARKPDLAESQNLRGVILMREGIYDKAEAALNEALRLDPKFWNARFNLAEIPFLKKDWPEARKRFSALLASNAAELQGDATQLIQYKILLTYLLEGNESMVDSILAKFELSPDTPAVHYANAAIALTHQNIPDAKNWMAVAEKNFSPQLNKLFAESLYEIGWLQKQAGQQRPALTLLTPAERATKAKALVQSKFEQAQQAFEQRDFDGASKLAAEADVAEPNQPAILNLRGEILLEQQNYAEAETLFQKALKVDPKFREAQFNLAEVPFRQKDYARSRDRFEALLKQTPGGEKNQAAQLIKFKVFMTQLLEGKDARAQKMMEQFQFSGDTPALYYAQAAWEFQHGNADKANDWIDSARKIYPLASNSAYGAGFYDLGWLKSAATTASPAPAAASDAAALAMARNEGAPAIEPSPIPGSDTKAEEAAASPVPGMSATAAGANADARASQAPVNPTPPVINAGSLAAAGSPARPEDIPAKPATAAMTGEIPSASPAASAPVVAGNATAQAAVQSTPAPAENVVAQASATVTEATPATVLAPATVRDTARATFSERLDRFTDPQTLLFGALLLGGVGILALVIVPEVRRRLGATQIGTRPAPATGPELHDGEENQPAQRMVTRFTAGPRHVSVQLKATEPSIRRAVMPLSKRIVEPAVIATPEPEVNGEEEIPAFAGYSESAVGPVIEQGSPLEPIVASPELASSNGHVAEPVEEKPDVFAKAEPTPEIIEPEFEETFEAAVAIEGTMESAEVEEEKEPIFEPAWNAMAPAVAKASTISEPEAALSEAEAEPVVSAPEVEAIMAEAEPVVSAIEPPPLPEYEPIAQGQPVPYQTSVAAEPVAVEPAEETRYLPGELAASAGALAGIGALRGAAAPTSQENFKSEPTETQPMPDILQTPIAPVLRTPTAGPQTQPAHVAPAPQAAAGGMNTAVQITLSCEIASMQLTSSFKMGALQLRPVSKVVTMRLSPSQQPQPAMALQVNFEVAKVQPAPGSLGQVRLSPSQQQKPSSHSSPSFSITGLQLMSGHDAAPVQLTPQAQGQASVYLTAAFNITTVEFSPSFDIAAIILNSNAKTVAVQLPGSGANSIENAPVFEITNVQLAGNGDIAMLQLHPVGAKKA